MHHSAHNQVGHDHSRHLCDWFDNNDDENASMEHWIASGGLCCVHGDGLAGVGHDNHAAASDCCLPPFMRGPAFAALMFDDGTRVLLEDEAGSNPLPECIYPGEEARAANPPQRAHGGGRLSL